MRFDVSQQTLLTDSGAIIKKLDCPLNMNWEDLETSDSGDFKRYCRQCKKNVVNATHLDESEALAIVRYDPEACFHVSEAGGSIQFEREGGLRRVYTSRNLDDIVRNSGVEFWPVIKRVEPSPEIGQKLMVCQNSETGRVWISGDYRMPCEPPGVALDWFRYNPTAYKGPVAAYMAPQDLQVDERVLLVDLIEDIVGTEWNQGDSYRLQSAEAVWNGSDFVIDRTTIPQVDMFMG